MKLSKTPLVLALMLGALVTVTFLTSAVQAQAGRGGAPRPGGGEAAQQARTPGQAMDMLFLSPQAEQKLREIVKLPPVDFEPSFIDKIVKLPDGYTYSSVSVESGEENMEACAEECNMSPEPLATEMAGRKCIRVSFTNKKGRTFSGAVCWP